MGKKECIAVLTGDLIEYRKFKGGPDQYVNYLVDALESISKRFDFRYQIFRGDSFQGLLRQPEVALEVSLLIRSHLLSQPHIRLFLDQEKDPPYDGHERSSVDASDEPSDAHFLECRCDTRIAIGVGEAGFINEDNIGSSDGQAFRFSGFRLDEMKRKKQNLSVATPWNEFNEEIEIECSLVDAIVDRWTREQAMVVYLSLIKKKQDGISKILRITQSGVSQRLSRTGFSSLQKTIDRFNERIKKFECSSRSDEEGGT